MGGLLGCWCNMLNNSMCPSNGLAGVRFNIEKVVELMTEYAKPQRQIMDDYHSLIAADCRLQDLLIRENLEAVS